MTIKAMTGLVPEWYTLSSQEDTEQATQFYCKPLTQPQMLQLQSYFDETLQRLKTEALGAAFKMGCRGWKNVADHKGDPLPWTLDNMDFIPADVAVEVGSHIIYISSLEAEAVKN